MYEQREVFTQTPLALVAVEVSFSDAPRLRKSQTLDDFAILLERDFPLVETFEEAPLSFSGGLPPQVGTPMEGRRLLSVDSGSVVTLLPNRLALETTKYNEFPSFLSYFKSCVRSLISLNVRPPLRRVGLRYIDEIQVPDEVKDARDWSSWIDPVLVNHLTVGPQASSVKRSEGMMMFDLGSGMGLNFRYAALPQGGVVTGLSKSAGVVRDSSRPCFVLDLDGYQEFDSNAGVSPLDVDTVDRILTSVHPFTGETFHRSITDKSRSLFRGEIL
jgi:uncharacterized protein (TIGR04255 family)